MSAPVTLAELINTLPQTGQLRWIGLRPERRAGMLQPDTAQLESDTGLVGDRYAGRSGDRQVTLIQYEHLAAIASLLGGQTVSAAMLRRNLLVSGLNLLALKGREFTIGDTRLAFTGLCHPCSYMETVFGAGGYNAVRGHGGITARVLVGGSITVGDPVMAVPMDSV